MDALTDKIADLFKQRMLPELMDCFGFPDAKKKSILDQLTNLQLGIYELDSLLENTWEVRDTVRMTCWKKITHALLDLGIPVDFHKNYCQEIQVYERRELALREGVFPSHYGLEDYYFYKSCDVRLIRKLIYLAAGVHNQMSQNEQWKFFDISTEIIDDLDDLEEDRHFYNGNLILLNLYLSGYEKTVNYLVRFLEGMEDRIPHRQTNYYFAPPIDIKSITLKKIALALNLAKNEMNKFWRRNQKSTIPVLKELKILRQLPTVDGS